jgi:hypothetical protein
VPWRGPVAEAKSRQITENRVMWRAGDAAPGLPAGRG